MSNENRDVILDCLDNATDGIESARKHIEVAIRRAKNGGYPNLTEKLEKHCKELGDLSNFLGECDI